MGKILVTGGAGYIGSHIVSLLRDKGEDVVVIDNLSEGHRAAIGDTPLIEADFGDVEALAQVMRNGAVEFVVHMAAFCEVGQSMLDPAAYYANNVTRSLALLEAARLNGVTGIVFSSTAAVYGEPDELPVTEDQRQFPTNPYGETKLAFERALGWYRGAYDMRYVALRYFNAAGAHPNGEIGEDHAHETHLIPRLIQAAQRGGESMPIFGDDYPTPDGTCVRDYVHVLDLAHAHVLALEAMRSGKVSGASFNLGNGEGFSVRQVADMVAEVAGAAPPTHIAPRRPGDPASLVASSARIRGELGWEPVFPGLSEIIRTAWAWHSSHPKGYDDSSG